MSSERDSAPFALRHRYPPHPSSGGWVNPRRQPERAKRTVDRFDGIIARGSDADFVRAYRELADTAYGTAVQRSKVEEVTEPSSVDEVLATTPEQRRAFIARRTAELKAEAEAEGLACLLPAACRLPPAACLRWQVLVESRTLVGATRRSEAVRLREGLRRSELWLGGVCGARLAVTSTAMRV